jgi:opacity protein-like surface antigen
MKKTLLPALIVLLFFSSTTLAQLPFKLGVRAGLNIASLSWDPELPSVIDKSSRTGFKFGALAELGFVPMFAIQIEPMYVQKGGNISAGGQESKNNLSYLEIPILLKLKIPTPGPITPYVFAGPNIGILLSASSETGGQSTDIKDEISSTDFALDLGAGVGFKVAPLVVLIIDARYSLGLSDIFNDTGKLDFAQSTGIVGQKIKTTGIQIVAGVMFDL